MRRLTLLPALLLALAIPAAALADAYPDRIDLPDDFAPEGIAVGQGHTFYVGSLAGAGIWRGDLRTGDGALLVEGGGPFVGMDVDALGRLWVAGGDSGVGHVFDADTGAPIATFDFADPGTSFINDVIVTRDAAYFTDSFNPVLYRVDLGSGGAIGTAGPIALDPAEIGFVPGAFNVNGIEATSDGNRLIVVNSTAGALFTVDPASGDAAAVDLGGSSVSSGDGILLAGRTLYVVRNVLNLVAVVELDPDLSSGTVVEELTSAEFDVPTTIARHGSDLYAVNARFGQTDPAPPPDPYWVTRLDR